MSTSYLYANIRIALAIVGIFGILFAPWWVPLACMILLALRYPAWEVLAIGLCMDFMWLPQTTLFPLPLFTIAAVALVWALLPLRNQFLTP